MFTVTVSRKLQRAKDRVPDRGAMPAPLTKSEEMLNHLRWSAMLMGLNLYGEPLPGRDAAQRRRHYLLLYI